MNRWKVGIIQFLVFYGQLYLLFKYSTIVAQWFESLGWWITFNVWLNSSLEVKMLGMPIVIVGCLLFCFLYSASFLYPQYLIEKLKD